MAPRTALHASRRFDLMANKGRGYGSQVLKQKAWAMVLRTRVSVVAGLE
jgi:hypothetical protein